MPDRVRFAEDPPYLASLRSARRRTPRCPRGRDLSGHPASSISFLRTREKTSVVFCAPLLALGLKAVAPAAAGLQRAVRTAHTTLVDGNIAALSIAVDEGVFRPAAFVGAHAAAAHHFLHGARWESA